MSRWTRLTVFALVVAIFVLAVGLTLTTTRADAATYDTTAVITTDHVPRDVNATSLTATTSNNAKLFGDVSIPPVVLTTFTVIVFALVLTGAIAVPTTRKRTITRGILIGGESSGYLWASVVTWCKATAVFGISTMITTFAAMFDMVRSARSVLERMIASATNGTTNWLYTTSRLRSSLALALALAVVISISTGTIIGTVLGVLLVITTGTIIAYNAINDLLTGTDYAA